MTKLNWNRKLDLRLKYKHIDDMLELLDYVDTLERELQMIKDNECENTTTVCPFCRERF